MLYKILYVCDSWYVCIITTVCFVTRLINRCNDRHKHSSGKSSSFLQKQIWVDAAVFVHVDQRIDIVN